MSEEEYEVLQNAASDSTKNRALRMLGSRNLSSGEIEKRLINKGETPQAAQQTVQWLEDIGLVNDKEYASSIVRHYIAKGYGLARIREELYKRGIDRELWEEALSDLEGMEDAAYEFIAKKLRGETGKEDLRRAAKTLCSRGYSYEEARTAVNRYLESIEETEDSDE